MTTAYGQIADEVDRKSPETRHDDGFQGGSDFNDLAAENRTEISNPSRPARTRPANSLSRVVRRSEPRAMRGFVLWAPD